MADEVRLSQRNIAFQTFNFAHGVQQLLLFLLLLVKIVCFSAFLNDCPISIHRQNKGTDIIVPDNFYWQGVNKEF